MRREQEVIMSDHTYDVLKLENQLCFPLYACSREVIKLYKPFLDEINLTYTQYLVMMVLWEGGPVTVKEVGRRLFLDSGTLTPLLKKMESKGLLTRNRSPRDERNLIISLTRKGERLKEKAVMIPSRILDHLGLETDDAHVLYQLLYKVLSCVGGKEKKEGKDLDV